MRDGDPAPGGLRARLAAGAVDAPTVGRMHADGMCQPGFEAVRSVFEGNFDAGLEVGASVA